MKNLVIGGSGFIGRSIVKCLAEQGHDVSVFDINKIADFDGLNINYIKGDILCSAELFQAMQGVDHVYAMAGLLGTSELYATPQRAIRVNIEGIVNILESAVKSNVLRVFLPSTPYVWRNIYSVTKHSAEEFFKAYHLAYKIDTRILRLWNIYGPHQLWEPVEKIVPEFCLRALANQPLKIYGTGENHLFLMHVQDVAELAIMFMHASGGGYKETYDTKRLCHSCSVVDLAKMIIALANSDSEIVFFPKRMGEFYGTDYIDCCNIANLVTKETSYMNLKEGLKRTLQYYSTILPDYIGKGNAT